MIWRGSCANADADIASSNSVSLFIFQSLD